MIAFLIPAVFFGLLDFMFKRSKLGRSINPVVMKCSSCSAEMTEHAYLDSGQLDYVVLVHCDCNRLLD